MIKVCNDTWEALTFQVWALPAESDPWCLQLRPDLRAWAWPGPLVRAGGALGCSVPGPVPHGPRVWNSSGFRQILTQCVDILSRQVRPPLPLALGSETRALVLGTLNVQPLDMSPGPQCRKPPEEAAFRQVWPQPMVASLRRGLPAVTLRTG